MNKSLLALIGISMLHAVFAQTNETAKGSSLVERARRGDGSAISEMEKSGDVQELKFLLQDPVYAKSGTMQVRGALARLGDQESLQYFACRSLTNVPEKMQLLLRDEYDHIGGSFMVQIYRQLLDSDPRFLAFVKKNRKHRYSDVMVTLPSTRVLQYLPKLLPNANIPSPPPDDPSEEETKSKWKSWIDTHQNEIQPMRPSGDGINFSSSFCADFKKENTGM